VKKAKYQDGENLLETMTFCKKVQMQPFSCRHRKQHTSKLNSWNFSSTGDSYFQIRRTKMVPWICHLPSNAYFRGQLCTVCPKWIVVFDTGQAYINSVGSRFHVRLSNCEPIFSDSHSTEIWARILKDLWSPGIDCKEWIPPAYVAWRAGTITLYSSSVPSLHRLFKNSSSGF
jgi:hypothetical protein